MFKANPGKYFYPTGKLGQRLAPVEIAGFEAIDPGLIDSLDGKGLTPEGKTALRVGHDLIVSQGGIVHAVTVKGGVWNINVRVKDDPVLMQLHDDAEKISNGEKTWEEVLDHRAPDDEIVQSRLRKISKFIPENSNSPLISICVLVESFQKDIPKVE